VHYNFALFLLRQDERSQGLRHLEKARALSEVSPAEMLIAEIQFFPDQARLEPLLRVAPESPSVEVERALALGKYWMDQGDPEKAYRWLASALEKSRQSGLSLPERRAAVLLGKWLERRRNYEEAELHYRKYAERNGNLQIPEILFPYSEVVTPLFDGWVRSLVRLGRHDQAIRAIQALSRIRREKAERLRELSAAPGEVADELSRLALAGSLEISDSSTQPLLIESEAGPFTPDTPYSVLELWPDGRQVYAWVTTGSQRRFQELPLPEAASRMISELIGGFHSTGGFLPASPPITKLQELYRCLFRPIQDSIAGPALLVIPHKELQALPLEILVDEEGRSLLERYHFSYLPALDPTRRPTETRGDPVLVLPRDLDSLPESRRDALFFQRAFPSLKIVRDPLHCPTPAAWIHISSHFRLDDGLWIASNFSDGGQNLSALNLADRNLECSLLSLGACDLANGFSVRIPYWLGFCEIFLSSRIPAMVVSRWEMDELAAQIYRDFFLHCRRGKSMDEALSLARRSFRKQTLRRGAARVSGRHPFFWAGITYVGEPGTRLVQQDRLPSWRFILPVAACLALAGRRLFRAVPPIGRAPISAGGTGKGSGGAGGTQRPARRIW
jgi:tetratricopeptide (TPR) repeat protein